MNIVVIIISGILGATVTFYISDKLKQSAVRVAAADCSIVFIFSRNIKCLLVKKYTASIYRNLLHRNGFFSSKVAIFV
jgi:hypothetical protein